MSCSASTSGPGGGCAPSPGRTGGMGAPASRLCAAAASARPWRPRPRAVPMALGGSASARRSASRCPTPSSTGSASHPSPQAMPLDSVEPPCTDPYARWCGRGGAARLPPIPICASALPGDTPADRAGSSCEPAGRLALVQREGAQRLGSRSDVAESRSSRLEMTRAERPAHTWCGRQELQLEDPAQVVVLPTRCASKQAPPRSIAQATLSRRSATERRARACPWPRARSDWYLSWLTGSRWAATRAQW